MSGSLHKSSISVNLIVHFSIWLSFFFLPLILMPKPPELSSQSFNYINHFIFVFICASLFYSNYFIFIPRFLLKKRIVEYIILIVLSIFAVLVLLYFFPTQNHRMDIIPDHPPFPEPKPNLGDSHGSFPRPLPRHFPFINPSTVVPFIIWILSSGIRMTSEWYKSERQNVIIEKEKLNTELAFLKSQVNPHFIFNVLNNICYLARIKSDATEEAIIKLSHLLRYNLYDFKHDKVSLDKEIQYLNDYIDIQKLRLYNNIKVNFIIKGNTDIAMIEPLLFIPFVENAFKHGISTTENGEINIILVVTSNILNFRVQNPVFHKLHQEETEKGLGLNNVLRRLNILYPDKHEITLSNNGSEYIADLKIILND
jgi:two-component system, LytTR family, sensor kinase